MVALLQEVADISFDLALIHSSGFKAVKGFLYFRTVLAIPADVETWR